MARHVVARSGEIPEGGRTIVNIGGLPIGIFNIDGEYFAILNRCPHQGAPLCEGHLWPGLLVSSEPGEYTNRAEVPIISCIWHGWEFDLRTGQSVCDPQRLRVRNYDVKVEAAGTDGLNLHVTTYAVEELGGVIVVDLDRRPSTGEAAKLSHLLGARSNGGNEATDREMVP